MTEHNIIFADDSITSLRHLTWVRTLDNGKKEGFLLKITQEQMLQTQMFVMSYKGYVIDLGPVLRSIK